MNIFDPEHIWPLIYLALDIFVLGQWTYTALNIFGPQYIWPQTYLALKIFDPDCPFGFYIVNPEHV